jgi:hypothetical protein
VTHANRATFSDWLSDVSADEIASRLSDAWPRR